MNTATVLKPILQDIVSLLQFELLICVQDDQDPVITLVNKLKERYPKVECRMFMGESLMCTLSNHPSVMYSHTLRTSMVTEGVSQQTVIHS